MKRLTREQAAIIGIHTTTVCGPFIDIHRRAEKLLGRPVFDAEFRNLVLAADLRKLNMADFLAICAEDGPEEGGAND